MSSFQEIGKLYKNELPKQVLEDIIEEVLQNTGLLNRLEEVHAEGLLDFYELDGYISVMFYGKSPKRWFFVTGIDSQAVVDWNFFLQQVVVFSVITISVQYLDNMADADIITKLATKIVKEKLS